MTSTPPQLDSCEFLDVGEEALSALFLANLKELT